MRKDKEDMHTPHLLLAGGRRLVLSAFFAVLCASTLQAQDIHIKIVDGRNGHPLTDAIEVRASAGEREPFLLLRTGKDGAPAIVRLGDEHAVPTWDRYAGVAQWSDIPTSGSLGNAEKIAIHPAWNNVDCRFREEISPPSREKFYSVQEILRSGVAASNSCGKFRAQAKPGELILYARLPHWLEKVKR